MTNNKVDGAQIHRIFSANKLGDANKIEKINIGFTNEIFLVNDKYILKICSSISNEKNFMKEVYCYSHFGNKIPVPNLAAVDTTKSIIDRYYMIYEYVVGQNLFAKWHLFDQEQRKNLIKHLADMMKTINSSALSDLPEVFDNAQSWHNTRITNVTNHLNYVESQQILDGEFIESIRKFIESHHHLLFREKLGLTYWDLHFDNILVEDDKVAGIIDFERTEIMSIDYVLSTIRRMAKFPYLYAAEEYEQYTNKEDYKYILAWLEECYKELFDFDQLDRRLDLYSIEYDLGLLRRFPDVMSLKARLAETVNHHINA